MQLKKGPLGKWFRSFFVYFFCVLGADKCNAHLKHIKQQNVRNVLCYTALSTLTYSLCQWNIFDAYLSVLASKQGHSYANSCVGLAESISGSVSFCSAIPIGIIVDKFSRAKLCRIAAVFGLLCAGISFIAFATDWIVGIAIMLFLGGLYSELAESSSQALFADSLNQGDRLEKMTLNNMIATCGLSMGPGILVCVFYFYGNDWTISVLHVPLLFGCCLAPFSCFFLSRLQDVRVRSRSNSYQLVLNASVEHRPSVTSLLSNTEKKEFLFDDCVTYSRRGSVVKSIGRCSFASKLDDATGPIRPVKGFGPFGTNSVPYFVVASDLLRMIGGGMTVKFFGLFFINDYGFGPVKLSLLFWIYPLCISFFMHIAQRVSKLLGRPQAVVLWQTLGLVSLIAMVYVRNVWILVFVFLIRGSFTNAVAPIDRSIIMDYVRTEHRGKWNAVESLASISWSGSAIFGGYLADAYDYRFTFFITTILYSFALVVYLPLLWLASSSSCPQSSVDHTDHEAQYTELSWDED